MRAALAEVPEDATVVLVHDAARPLITNEVIERVITALEHGWDGAVPTLSIADTVKRVDGEAIAETLDRTDLVTAQTPQAFDANVLRGAFSTLQQTCYYVDRLRLARGSERRTRARCGRRSAPAQGDDAGRPRAGRILAVIVDYHMHLRAPDEQIEHTVEAVEPYVETAADRNVDEIGFTEHVYYFEQTRHLWSMPYHLERCVYDIEPYVDAVVDAKRRGYPVKLGHRGRLRARP